MNCEKVCRRITAGAFLAIIGVCLVLILGQFVIKNVFIEIFGMDNAITDMSVTGGSDGMISVDWEGLYPFSDKEENTVQETEDTLVDIYVNKVRSVTNVIDMYSDDYLPFKENMKIPSGLFDKIIGNKMVDTDNIYLETKTAGTLVRSPFYQEFSDSQVNTEKLVAGVVELRDYLAESDIDLLYVQAPIKEDKYDEEYVSEYGLSYENVLADSLLCGLSENDVDTLDLREELHNDGILCRDAFFMSDNHWNIETAFWATGVIADKLNQDYNFSFNMEYFNVLNYNKNIYKDWVQGTIGRSVTLVNVPYDDITVYEPKFETKLNIKIPNLNMDNTGSFLETMINPKPFERRSTVYHGAYDAFAYSKPPVTEVTNCLDTGNDEKTVLLLRESFAGPVITYMSLGIGKLYAVTPEGFTGSIRSYIDQVRPDMVVILYTAPTTNEMTSKYDFR
ncbi:MAG: hypothetical protein ACI4GD_00950 [Lachnospiraceae bacterium]